VNDFWLNEGFTVYFELRIMEALYGPERMAMLEVLGRQELAEEIAGLGAGSKDTHLRLSLAGRNPDDGMTTVAYDKGAALLRLIERGVKVKATGFGRVELDVSETLREIAAVDPGALIFGTDLPGTRAQRPFEEADIDLILEALGEPLANRVLHDNALDWYLRWEPRI